MISSTSSNLHSNTTDELLLFLEKLYFIRFIRMWDPHFNDGMGREFTMIVPMG